MKILTANRLTITTEISRMSRHAALCLFAFCSLCVMPQWLAAQVPVQFASHSQRIEKNSDEQLGKHGGSQRRVDGLLVETVVQDGGIQIFLSDPDTQALSALKVRGVAMIRIEGETKSYRYDLLPDAKNQLSAAANLTRFNGRQVVLDIMLTDLPTLSTQSDQRARQPVRFREMITLSPTVQQLAEQAIAIQKICPVSGRQLGTMGEPLPVPAGSKTVYVCCSTCVATVQKETAKYASGKPPIVVSQATEADGVLIAKQKFCPVMDEPLGGMGQPIKVMIGETPIFLCCKGCIKKIQAEPAKIMIGDKPLFVCCEGCSAKVKANPDEYINKYYEAVGKEVRPGVIEATLADLEAIAAQKSCPVMDEELGGMGAPQKVNVNGKAVYICCAGCAKKLTTEPAVYLNKLAKAGVTPPDFK